MPEIKVWIFKPSLTLELFIIFYSVPKINFTCRKNVNCIINACVFITRTCSSAACIFLDVKFSWSFYKQVRLDFSRIFFFFYTYRPEDCCMKKLEETKFVEFCVFNFTPDNTFDKIRDKAANCKKISFRLE